MPLLRSPRAAPSRLRSSEAPTVHAQLADDGWQQTAILAARQVVAVIVAGYEKAPLLVAVLSALLVLPAVALAVWMHARRREKCNARNVARQPSR